MSTTPGLDDRFVQAIQRQRLPAFATEVLEDPEVPEEARDLAARADCACTTIGERVQAEYLAVSAALQAVGVAASASTTSWPRQLHRLELDVEDRRAARRAVEALTGRGYAALVPPGEGAQASFWSLSSHVRLLRQEDVTFDLRVRWADEPPPSRLRRVLRPTPADWDVVDLPPSLAAGYRLVRPLRLLGDRLRRSPPDRAHLEPFLTTPRGLIPSLVDFTGVGPASTLVDLGSGDGRLVIGAAERSGCRAIGYETAPDLCAHARLAADHSPAGGRIRIVEGDARSADLTEADVVVAFLPVVLLRQLVSEVVPRLQAGTRLIAHEQSAFGPELVPDRSTPLIGEGAVTVAHEWFASRADR